MTFQQQLYFVLACRGFSGSRGGGGGGGGGGGRSWCRSGGCRSRARHMSRRVQEVVVRAEVLVVGEDAPSHEDQRYVDEGVEGI